MLWQLMTLVLDEADSYLADYIRVLQQSEVE